MKKLSTHLLLLLITSTLMFSKAYAQPYPTIYATVNSGLWGTVAIWETFPGNAGNTPGSQNTGTITASAPSGTSHVYIRNGHTVSMLGTNRACLSMTIENGGKLWASDPTARRLQLANGGTGFLYPQSGIITNNGIMGGAGDGLYFEAGTNCQNATITGTGSTIVQRLRMPGGLGTAGGGVVNIIIDQNISFTQAANYAVSAAYNPAATDNYSITVNAGKVATISDVAGYFNSNSGTATGGTYTYNINGTMDLTASTQTASNLTAFSPAGGIINLNVTGTLKTGAAFNSSPTALGVANLNVANGATIDATLATVMNFNANNFVLTGSANVKRTVPNDGTKVEFPISTGSSSYTPVTISSITGPADVYTALVKNTFTNTPPAKTILKEWNITEAIAGGNEDTLRFSWITADEAGSGGFDNAGTVSIIRWNGTGWDYTPATVTGTGTVADPFVAKGFGFTAFGLFALTSSDVLAVSLVNVRALIKQNGIQLDFGNATELDVTNYVVEKSGDGRMFNDVSTLLPKANNGSLSNYSYLDAAPFSGNNFYRIRATETNGNKKYSAIVNINYLKNSTKINVYPNPLIGKTLSMQMENLEKGVYAVSVFNAMGQKVFSKQLKHEGRSATIVEDLPASLKAGTYSLEISSNNFRSVKNIMIQ